MNSNSKIMKYDSHDLVRFRTFTSFIGQIMNNNYINLQV